MLWKTTKANWSMWQWSNTHNQVKQPSFEIGSQSLPLMLAAVRGYVFALLEVLASIRSGLTPFGGTP